jgi:predicted DsbA family dithiol-disulfide isomerase
MLLEVWTDATDPWSWVALARVQRALLDEEPDAVEVIPRAFASRPDLPPDGLPAEVAYAERFGSVEAARRAFADVAHAGGREGLAFRFDLLRRVRPSATAHRLVAIAGQDGLALPALEALLRGFFRAGADIGDPRVAVALVARATGLDPGALRAALDAGAGTEELERDARRGRRLGLVAVPFLVAGEQVTATGAIPAREVGQLLAAARDRAAA